MVDDAASAHTLPTPGAPLGRDGWVRVLGLCAIAFVLLMGYAVARPATESIFLTEHGSESLPRVWLLVGVLAAVVTSLFNRTVARRELAWTLAAICVVSIAVLGLLIGARSAGVPGTAYALYIWKDVYVVVLIETFWAFANAVFPFKTARWSYGLFCVMGSLGGMFGNWGVGPIAKQIGTERALWLLVPIMLLAAALALALSRVAGAQHRQGGKVSASLVEGLRIVRASRYLGLVLIMIGLVQIVVTLIDYQANQYIEATWLNVDERTEVIGQIYGAIDIGAIALQLLTGVVVRLLGVGGTLLGIPALLGASLLAFLLSPRFFFLATAKVASKALDYSLFRAAKEMLYLPLSYEEKTQGKGVVDILTYRVAKGGASMLLLALVELAAPAAAVGGVSLLLCVAWGGCAWLVARQYRAITDG
jgi:AAA family ATP:ADP antiporter